MQNDIMTYPGLYDSTYRGTLNFCVHDAHRGTEKGPLYLNIILSGPYRFVHDPMCPRPDVSKARCIQGPVCPRPAVSKIRCVHGPMCSHYTVLKTCNGVWKEQASDTSGRRHSGPLPVCCLGLPERRDVTFNSAELN